MSGPDLTGTDPVGVSWDAFVREDRALLAPPRLESRVQQEVQRRLTASVSRGHRRMAPAWWRHRLTMTAAALCLTCLGAGLGHWLALPSRTAGPAQSLALANGRSTRTPTLASAENTPTPRPHGRTPQQRTTRPRARSAEPPVTVAVLAEQGEDLILHLLAIDMPGPGGLRGRFGADSFGQHLFH